MISVSDAEKMIMETASLLPTQEVGLEAALGRVLREVIIADRDFPPFDRVAMDGIAIRFEDFQKGVRNYRITGLQAAGNPPLKWAGEGTCLEVMTGAILPQGVDVVVRYEDATLANGHATIELDEVFVGQNIHQRGSDRPSGALLVKPGVCISPAEIGVAATVGKTRLQVTVKPRVAVISSGDELVPIEQQPLPHQIRQSNVHALSAALRSWGVEVSCHHVFDDKKQIKSTLNELLLTNHALILSGGVSMGKLDYLPEVLTELGVKKVFHRVAQRPGKPFWFGCMQEGAVVFAFPGNPVSSFMCLHRYFKPWLQRCLGQIPEQSVFAQLTSDFTFKPALTYFLQVKLSFDQSGLLQAEPRMGGGSGDLANLVDTDAFMELPAGESEFFKGQNFRVWRFRI